MSSLKRASVIVKMENRCLYCGEWAWWMEDVLRTFDIEVVHLTRIDLALDLQSFADGLDPQVFISRYLSSGLKESTEQYIRVGSNRYCAMGTKRLTSVAPDLKIDRDSTQTSYDYLRFGTRKSGVCAYLYNKTKELLEGKKKPWIQKLWFDNNLIQDPDKPVYRLEFSIQSKGMTVEDSTMNGLAKLMGLKNLRSLRISDFADTAKVENIFWGFCGKYWRFKKVTPVKYRKDMPNLNLFDAQFESTVFPRDISRAMDSGVSERNASKCVERLLRDYPGMESEKRKKLHEAAQVMMELGLMKKNVFENDPPKILLDYPDGSEPWQLLVKNYLARPVQITQLRKIVNYEVSKILERWRGATLDQLILAPQTYV